MERISKGRRYNLHKILPGRQNKLAFKKMFHSTMKDCTPQRNSVTGHHTTLLLPNPMLGNWSRADSGERSPPTVSPTSLPVAPGFFLECFHPNVDHICP